MEDKIIAKKEDYEEPRCPLNTGKCEVCSFPVARVTEKLDEYLNKKDYDGASRHLKYWLSEAKARNDKRGELTVLNEQIGLYRKTSQKEKGLEAISSALSLLYSMDMEETVTFGTTLINAATGYKAFGMAERALPLYEKAKEVYERLLSGDDRRLGGLYNNMALTLSETGDFEGTEALFFKALGIMSKAENGEAECAVTYLNLADLVMASAGIEAGEEKIDRYLSAAAELLDTPTLPHDGYYAFVCEKCAGVFGYYGWFMKEKELTERARQIYERI